MTIHIGIDTGCNLGCSYCYEEPDREQRGNHIKKEYDLDAIFDRLLEFKEFSNETPGLHGGEPLLIPVEDIRKMFEFIDEHWDGQPHIQTNGTLIEDEHIEIFKEFNVNVGISCDGPDELNDLRKARAEKGGKKVDITNAMTDRTLDAIKRCSEAGVSVGIITVLHEHNAGTDEKLEVLLDWIDNLNQSGVTGHFNPAIPYDDIQTDESLSPERLKEVFLRCWEWMKEESYRNWDPMRQYQDNLLGNSLRDCVNNRCDVHNAGAAKIVLGDGESTGCGKTWSEVGDGEPFLQGPSTGNEYGEGQERYEMLKQIPQGEGGCQGCDYWNVCQGGCPASGLDQDYRNKTRWCVAKKALYSRIEDDMRAMFPNFDLITDLPWNADIQRLTSKWNYDGKPFAAMDPGEPGRSSVSKGYDHQHGKIEERVPEEILPEKSFDTHVEEYKEKYDEEDLFIDREKGHIHADSDGGWENAD